MNDEKIIELFFERSEQAIQELDEKYGKVFHSIAYNILNNRQDSEECVNDAYWGTWNAIPPASPKPLLTFVCKIVRNLSLKRYEKNTAAKRNSSYDVEMEELENCLSSATTVRVAVAVTIITTVLRTTVAVAVATKSLIFVCLAVCCQGRQPFFCTKCRHKLFVQEKQKKPLIFFSFCIIIYLYVVIGLIIPKNSVTDKIKKRENTQRCVWIKGDQICVTLEESVY